jgi:hypothetical protein
MPCASQLSIFREWDNKQRLTALIVFFLYFSVTASRFFLASVEASLVHDKDLAFKNSILGHFLAGTFF